MIWRLILLLTCISISVSAQTPDDNWIFGRNAWAKFNAGIPTAVGTGPVDVDEGSACISDENGNLLFSTNGTIVFDRNSNPMPNGQSLRGHFSSTQNALIVPKPLDKEKRYYYVFTVAAQVNWPNTIHTGLEYVLIDMQANGGLGDVIQQSQELVPFTCEKLHATYHANGRDVWVVTHELSSANFYSFLVTCEGITDALISNTGNVNTYGSYANGAIGAMKLSPDGTKIATTYTDVLNSGYPYAAYLELGTFNKNTGEVIITGSVEKISGTNITQGYGVEFSPDNSKLYWSLQKMGPNPLIQYDLNTSNWQSTETVITTSQVKSIMGIQLGPNGKIYMARSNGSDFVSVIDQPNNLGTACNYIDVAFNFAGYANLGLPNQWMFPYPNIAPRVDSTAFILCNGEAIEFVAPTWLGEDIIWNTGDTGPIQGTDEAGIFWVTQSTCSFDTAFFIVEDDPTCNCAMYFPNAFTPNGDGNNELFGGTSNCPVLEYKLSIYNRWGDRIFESTDINLKWNGDINKSVASEGIYIFYAEWLESTNIRRTKKIKTGTISLIR